MPRGKNYVNQNKGMFLQAGGRQKVTEPCKYGAACNRRDCIYSHDDVAAAAETTAAADAPCMAYLAGLCVFTKGCRRRHPSAAECERLVARYGALPCRFGTECRTTGCLYNHDKVPLSAQCLPAAMAAAVQPTPVVSKSGTSSLAAWMPTTSSSSLQQNGAGPAESPLARPPVPPSMLQHSRPGAPLPPQSTAAYYPPPMMMPGGYYPPQQQQSETPYYDYEEEDEAPLPYHGGGAQPWYPPSQPLYGGGGTGPQSNEGEPYYNGGGDESYSFAGGGGPPFPSHGGGGAVFPMTTIGSWKPAPIAQPHQHASSSSYNTYSNNNSNYPPPPQPAASASASSSWESQFPALSASTSAWESQFPALLSNAPQSSSSSSSTIGNKNNNNDPRH
jgi:hypothetical protein